MSVARVLSSREELFLSSFYNFYKFTSLQVYKFTSLQVYQFTMLRWSTASRVRGGCRLTTSGSSHTSRTSKCMRGCLDFKCDIDFLRTKTLSYETFHTAWTLTKTSHMTPVSCVVPPSTVHVIQKQ